MKNLIIALLIIIAIGLGIYFLVPSISDKVDVILNQNSITDTTQTKDNAQPTDTQVVKQDEGKTIIGKSAGGRNITAYHYGTGDTNILFVGGIHGGYEWNTSLVAQETMTYLEANPEVVPANVKVTIIPVLNPDGLSLVVGTSTLSKLASNPPLLADTIVGRFNANNVDLNRNFDCDWQTDGKWQDKTVSGGSSVFSEPESQAIKNYIETSKPKAVVVWYSSVGGVFSSSCHNGVLEETNVLTNIYADASGYPKYEEFNFYEITGDMVNWLAKKNIPAISVLLTTHDDTEWNKNKAGVEAVLKHFSNQI
ncbi:hypothetical protein KKG48_00535 [Patescibacteria group bacterium]|nr:hypothetical protein [Patescibacteria group bacterium]